MVRLQISDACGSRPSTHYSLHSSSSMSPPHSRAGFAPKHTTIHGGSQTSSPSSSDASPSCGSEASPRAHDDWNAPHQGEDTFLDAMASLPAALAPRAPVHRCAFNDGLRSATEISSMLPELMSQLGIPERVAREAAVEMLAEFLPRLSTDQTEDALRLISIRLVGMC